MRDTVMQGESLRNARFSCMLSGMATPTTPGEILAGNIAAARVRRRLQQSELADRMRALGWKWVRQTVGEVESNRRRLTAEELYGLAEALEVSIPQLMTPPDPDGEVRLPGGISIGAVSVERLAGRGVNDRSILWDGTNVAAVAGRDRLPGVDPFDKELLAQPDFTEGPDKWHPGPSTQSHPDHGTGPERPEPAS
jgi:transcriptional regulator with XRE-family HTH domain